MRNVPRAGARGMTGFKLIARLCIVIVFSILGMTLGSLFGGSHALDLLGPAYFLLIAYMALSGFGATLLGLASVLVMTFSEKRYLSRAFLGATFTVWILSIYPRDKEFIKQC